MLFGLGPCFPGNVGLIAALLRANLASELAGIWGQNNMFEFVLEGVV
jgi:hypothetical protein